MSRRAARAVPAVAVAGLALTAGCGGGGSTSTGLVTEVGARLCVQTGLETAECFGGDSELLGGARVGECVTITWQTGSSGRVPEATAVAPADTPCAAV